MEQDHRFIRKRVHSMSRFKSYGTAISVLSDVEVIYMMEKGEFHPQVKSSQTEVGFIHKLFGIAS